MNFLGSGLSRVLYFGLSLVTGIYFYSFKPFGPDIRYRAQIIWLSSMYNSTEKRLDGLWEKPAGFPKI